MSASDSKLRDALTAIADALPDPAHGLSDPVFDFALKITPMVNVDLSITDGMGRVLLAWREDHHGRGWHMPGGIIRFNEPIHRRIAETARLELGVPVEAEDQPMRVHQFFSPPRGHFISLIFRCRLMQPLAADPWRFGVPKPGQLGWFTGAPQNLYPAHRAYAEMLDGLHD